jgi:hypothetical protein
MKYKVKKRYIQYFLLTLFVKSWRIKHFLKMPQKLKQNEMENNKAMNELNICFQIGKNIKI